MAATVDAVRAWCQVSDAEAQALQGPAAPIVLLARRSLPCTEVGDAKDLRIAPGVAPGLNTLGFMLPSSGMHHLILRRMKRPIVLTSGNLSDEPQAITVEALAERFAEGIDYVLDHGRAIARRVDDSVLRVVDGAPQLMRRARGFAPLPITLPAGFGSAPAVLAFGGELKNTFCLLRDGQAMVAPHLGDLADAATHAGYRRALADLQSYFDFQPQLHACDAHPEYLSSKLARSSADEPVEVLHHHAHIAACLADNGWPLDGGPVIGVALDGLGQGEGGALWGGEFAIADYTRFERGGTFKPVALLGGEQAMREPWRNTYAHLMAELKWPSFAMNYAELELFAFLEGKPRALLDGMLAKGVNSPLASSCARLFDAAAAAMGLCREQAAYEGQGAMLMEALVDAEVLQFEDDELGYPFAIPRLPGSRLPYIEPLAMWTALLGDLVLKTPVPTMAARFHKGLAKVICKMVDKLAHAHDAQRPLRHVALSGGVFQNRVLHERVACGPARCRLHRAHPPPGALQRRGAGARPGRRGGRARIATQTPGHRSMCLGIPGRIVEITHAANKLAMVEVLGVRREINIACVVNDEHPVDSCIGDWVLVHVGFAMSRIDEKEAQLTLEVLRMLGEAQTEIDAMRSSDAAVGAR